MIFCLLFYRISQFHEHCLTLQISIMSSFTKIFLVLTLSNLLNKALLQELCTTEQFLSKVKSVFTCDFQSTNENFNQVNNESKCIHFLGLPNMKVCAEMGLRYKIYSDDVNASISLRYYSNQETKHEIISMDNKNGWNQWIKLVCGDFQYGVSIIEKNWISHCSG